MIARFACTASTGKEDSMSLFKTYIGRAHAGKSICIYSLEPDMQGQKKVALTCLLSQWMRYPIRVPTRLV